MFKFSKKGFTLIELMVVIGIIAILAAAGFVALGSTRPKARDARRQEDIKAIANAMEIFYSTNSLYPVGGWTQGQRYTIAPNNVFLTPSDPLTARSYSITDPVGAGASFCACAFLENTSGTGNANGTTCVYVAGATADYYCMSSQQ